MPADYTARNAWLLRKLDAPSLVALRKMQTDAYNKYGSAANPIEAMYDAGEMPDVVAAMPKEYVVTLTKAKKGTPK